MRLLASTFRCCRVLNQTDLNYCLFIAIKNMRLQLVTIVFSVSVILLGSCSSSTSDVTPTSSSEATVTSSPTTETPGAGGTETPVRPTETLTAVSSPTTTPEPSPTTTPVSPTVELFQPVKSTASLLFPDALPSSVASFLSQVEERGVVSTDAGRAFSNDSISAGGCLSAQNWRRHLAAGGQLTLFRYADTEEAKRAADRVPVYAICDGRSDWANDVYYFKYENLIIFLRTEDSVVYEVVASIAGPRFACARGFTSGPRACELSAS